MGGDLKLTESSDKNSCPTLCVTFFFFLIYHLILKKIFFYLAASSLSYGAWDLVS